MRCSTRVHEAYCGIDLHARTMYVCIVNRDGEILLHRNMPTGPEMGVGKELCKIPVDGL
jgi:hypothetical protein